MGGVLCSAIVSEWLKIRKSLGILYRQDTIRMSGCQGQDTTGLTSMIIYTSLFTITCLYLFTITYIFLCMFSLYYYYVNLIKLLKYWEYRS